MSLKKDNITIIATILFIIFTTLIPSTLAFQVDKRISSHGVINYSTINKLHVDGKYIKNDVGQIIQLKGVNLGCDNAIKLIEGEFGGELQFSYIKEWGCNVVRVMFMFGSQRDKIFYEDTERFYNYVRTLITWGRKYNIYVILAAIENTWGYPSDWDYWINMWLDISSQFVGNSDVLIYDIYNEPRTNTIEEWVYNAQNCINTIRSIDPETLIMIEDLIIYRYNHQGLEYLQTNPLQGENIVYSPHIYDGFDILLPEQQTIDYLKFKNQRNLQSWKWMLDNNKGPVVIGEFGIHYKENVDWEKSLLIISNEWECGYLAWQWIKAREGEVTQHEPGSNPAILVDWNGTANLAGEIFIDAI